LDCRHPAYGIGYSEAEGIAEAPPYFNFGFVVGTRELMNEIRKAIASNYQIALDYTKTDLHPQAGLTLSIVWNCIPYRCLPVRHNFWSTEMYLSALPDEATDLRILHYLAPPFQKHVDDQTRPMSAVGSRNNNPA
jgi:hypothetical protein